jgi:hypothetical protein
LVTFELGKTFCADKDEVDVRRAIISSQGHVLTGNHIFGNGEDCEGHGISVDDWVPVHVAGNILERNAGAELLLDSEREDECKCWQTVSSTELRTIAGKLQVKRDLDFLAPPSMYDQDHCGAICTGRTPNLESGVLIPHHWLKFSGVPQSAHV